MTQPGVEFAPTAEQWSVAVVLGGDGQKMVMVQIAAPNVVKVSFLSLDDATALFSAGLQEVERARSGLILPPGVTNGHRHAP